MIRSACIRVAAAVVSCGGPTPRRMWAWGGSTTTRGRWKHVSVALASTAMALGASMVVLGDERSSPPVHDYVLDVADYRAVPRMSTLRRMLGTVTRVGRCVYFIGGATVKDGPLSSAEAKTDLKGPQLSIFHLDKHQWLRGKTSRGVEPPRRDSHAACAVGTDVYILWGRFFQNDSPVATMGSGTTEMIVRDDVWVLHTGSQYDTGTWEEVVPATEIRPRGRIGHSATVDRNKIYVFGGNVRPIEQDTVDWVTQHNLYDPNNEHKFEYQWMPQSAFNLGHPTHFVNMLQLSHIYPTEVSEWHKNPVLKQYLEAYQALHTVRGGHPTNSLWVFDPDTQEWNRPTTTGTPPPQRSKHVAVCVDNRLFIMGGKFGPTYLSDVYTLDLETMHWEKQEIRGDAISPPRIGMGVHPCEDGRVILTGGARGTILFNDAYVWDPVESTCVQIPLRGKPFKHRSYHSSIQLGQNSHLLIGGGGWFPLSHIYATRLQCLFSMWVRFLFTPTRRFFVLEGLPFFERLTLHANHTDTPWLSE